MFVKKYVMKLKSFDCKTIEDATKQILIMTHVNSELVQSKITKLPKKIKRFTVLRSPHIDKKSREQFEMITYNRLITLQCEKEMNDIIFINHLYDNMPFGVSIKIIKEIKELY